MTDSLDAAPEGSRFFLRQEMTRGCIVPFAGGCAGVFSSKCPGKAGDCEDAAALIPFSEPDSPPTRGVLAIADGMGGQPAGALAASLAVQALHDSISAAEAPGDAGLRDAILNGFEEANRAVQAIGVGAATTLTVVEIQPKSIRPYHAGDSLILMLGQRGRIKLQTVSHSPVGYAVEAGLIEACDAMHHEDRHVLSNMIGSPEMRIDVGSSLELALRDTVVLASDGLFDNLHTDEIIELARKGPLEEVVEAIAARCRERMSGCAKGEPCKPDDLTFIVFRRNGR